MKITCPYCGVVGSVHDSMPGGKVRCPQCDKVFKVTEQKIGCPHCGVIGSVGGAFVDTKLRCPQCEKVFLLTQDLLTEPAVRDVVLVDEMDYLEGALALEASGVESLPEEEWLFPVPESEKEAIIVPESEPMLEVELVSELEMEPDLESVVVVTHESELEMEIKGQVIPEPESEPDSEWVIVTTPELELKPELLTELLPEAESSPVFIPESKFETTLPLADERITEDVKKMKTKAEGLESTVISTCVCTGCGESFHPAFLQEVDAKLYCGVCQLRTAASDTRQTLPKIGNGKLQGTLAALLLLGLLALVVLVLKKFGII